MARRTITLMGSPIINEDGAAGEAIYPGHLVSGVTTIIKHAVAGGPAARAFALERDELGKGIDDTYMSEAGASAYASGDYVKVGVFAPGQRVYAYVASGVTVSEGTFLESAGDGTLRAFSSGSIIGRALEAVTATALTRLRTELV